MVTVAQTGEARLDASERDRRILQIAARRMGAAHDFSAALDALEAAVGLVIPAARIFHLGDGDEGPVVGSIVSGLGLMVRRRQVVVVRRIAGGGFSALASLASLGKLGP